MPEELQPESENRGLYFQPSYDRANEDRLEWDITNMLGALQDFAARNTTLSDDGKGGKVRKVNLIYDAEAMGRIRRMFSTGKLILNKYHEKDAAEQVQKVIDFLTSQYALEPIQAMENLELLSDLIAKHLGENQQFKDKTHAKFIWDSELKKKLEFSVVKDGMTREETDYYNAIKHDWEKHAWLTTYYVVKCEGDAHILLSGPNLSGKSSTAIRFLNKCSYYLVYFWHVKKYNSEHIKHHPELANVPQRRFSIKKDVYVTTEAKELQDRFMSEQYQTIDINEGMEVATNVQSQKQEAVMQGIKRYTTRSYHNIVIWEYQVQSRATMMMIEGMNFWMQKMRKRFYVLSVPSTLVRKRDPYYFEELNKCKKESEISFWMRYANPNYIHTFRAPKLDDHHKEIFQRHYWAQKEKQAKSEKTRTTRTLGYDKVISDVYDRINVSHTLSLLELGDLLAKMGYNDNDKKAFMRDYGKFKRIKLWENFNEKEPVKA